MLEDSGSPIPAPAPSMVSFRQFTDIRKILCDEVHRKIIDISTHRGHACRKKRASMRTTVTIDKAILDELVKESGHKNKASAVREAATVYLRQRKREKIKGMRGKLKFDRTAGELRHYDDNFARPTNRSDN